MAMSIEDAITANESVGKKAFVLPTTAASTDGRGAKHSEKCLPRGRPRARPKALTESMVGVLADQVPMGGGDLAARFCVEDMLRMRSTMVIIRAESC